MMRLLSLLLQKAVLHARRSPAEIEDTEEDNDATIDTPIAPPAKRASPKKATNGRGATEEGSDDIFPPTESITKTHSFLSIDEVIPSHSPTHAPKYVGSIQCNMVLVWNV